MKSIDRREFIRTLVIGSTGFFVTTKIAPFSALGQVPWQERDDSILLNEKNEKFTLSSMFSPSKGIKNEFPAVSLDSSDTVWMTWTEETSNGEKIRLVPMKKNSFGSIATVTSESFHAIQPEILCYPEGGVIVWTEFEKPGVWKIRAAILHKGSVKKVVNISEAEVIAWRPCVIRDSLKNTWIIWEEKSDNHFQIKTRVLKDESLSPVLTVSAEKDKDNCRPAAVETTDDKIWIAWDRIDDPGNVNIVIRQINASGKFATDEIPVTRTAGLDIAPALAVDAQQRLWIGWHSNRWGNENKWDIPRWFRLKCYYGTRFHEPVSEPLGKSNTLSDTIQSFEFVNLHCTKDGKVVVTGRASHNFFIQYYYNSKWSPIYRLPEDGWGGRGQYLKVAEDSEGSLWVVRRDLGNNVLQRLAMPKEKIAAIPVVKATVNEAPNIIIPNAPQKPAFEPSGDYKFYFGDIHGHTWMSDGVGDVDEYYLTRRDFYKLDFASLTDHDTFVGNGLIPSEWELIKEVTTHFDEPGHFVTSTLR